MRHSVFISLVLILGWGLLLAPSQAGEIAALVADLKKGDKEKLRAIQDLAALGEKAGEAAPALVELLKTNNEDVRLAVALALGKIGAPAVEPLTKALASTDSGVRFYAVWGLAFVGPKAKSATPAVLHALKDPVADVRRKAAYALGRLDPDPATVVAALVAALGDSDADVRQTAAEALPKMSKTAVPVLIQALHSDKKELQHTAIKILGDIGSAAAPAIPELKTLLLANQIASEAAANALASIGATSVPALKEAAANDQQQVRALALRSLQKVGAAAVPTFIDLLGAKYVDVQRQAAALLGMMQVNDKSVVIGLGYATKDKDFEVRHNALQSLRRMGTAAKLAEPYIVALLTDIDPKMREDAFYALQGLGVDPRPGLKKALSHRDLAVRIKTASLMTKLNLEVDLAAPVLLEGLKQKDEALKMQAADALSLRGLQENEVLPIFLAGLKSDVASVRRQAAEAIARYGPKARQAAPALVAALDDADDSVCAQVLKAVRVVGVDPKTLLPAMVKVLRRKNPALHQEAAQVIFQVGPDALGDVIALLKNEDAPGVRLACLQTLAMVGPPAKDAVAALTNALADPSARIRMTAARALGNIGPAAKPAQDALTKAEQDPDANVRQIAAAALAQIRADANQQEFLVKGVITAGDPLDRVRGQHYQVVHTYPMKAGKMYTINLNSPWDNYLRLENPQGVQVAQDDDSGGMLNARITYQAPADGWYRIIVTTYAPRATGNYTLRVR